MANSSVAGASDMDGWQAFVDAAKAAVHAPSRGDSLPRALGDLVGAINAMIDLNELDRAAVRSRAFEQERHIKNGR